VRSTACPAGTVDDVTKIRTITSGGVEIACNVSDSIDDHGRPLAVCIHGFPDSPFTWRHLVPRLEAAGWRVATPFLRGYAPSTIPADGCLQTAASSLDSIAIHEQLGGGGDALIVGHDWGAPITYGAAGHAPDRWGRVVGMAVPPGPALTTAFLTNTDQLKKSWYMFFFQHPLADLVVPADDMAFIDMIWRDWSPGYDSAADAAAVKDALRDPANLAAAIGYYRAALSGVGVRDDLAEVQSMGSAVPSQPTLYLHGSDDGCIGAEVLDGARAGYGPNVTVDVLEGLAHFLHLESPDTVNDRIVEFAS
jgi:pimeloyl-ACP methyl ester carboxylesterase